MEYTTINNFGSSVNNNTSNPLSYCAVSGIDSGFMHTLGSGSGLVGPNSTNCQKFMSGYCANKWDGVCEILSEDNSRHYPNMHNPIISKRHIGNLTRGQILIRNTASEKYLKLMSSNCTREYHPFDPITTDTHLISKWVSSHGTCIPVYDVDLNTIENDAVMNKILELCN